MTLPRSAADVLSGHVVFELECIDRIYCNLYVPKLLRDLGVVGFIREHLGKPVASTAVLAARAGIGFTALDNGFAAVDDVAAVQALCDSFDEQVIWDLAAKWTALLPCPFTAEDAAAGYRYEVSVLQAEFSLTQVLDAPVTGRIFFE